MANEAVCIETPTEFRRYTVADGATIPIGTLMKLTSPNTCEASAANDDPFAGIAWEEKTASDGIVEITCAVNGIWDITATAAAVVAGNLVNIGAANQVLVADEVAMVAGSVVGKALEDSNATAGRVAVGRYI